MHTAHTAHRRRMLVAVTVAGAAVLVAGCAQDAPAGGGASAAPTVDATSPPIAVTGAAPAPLDPSLLTSTALFQEVEAQGIVVRWHEPGSSIAVILAGSGSGGGCIPQPRAAALEPNEPSIAVRFDPVDDGIVCTMDLRLHGWTLALPEPIDAGGVVPVRLVNADGTDDVSERQLGPDDRLTSPTADPQPTELPAPPAGEAAAPVPIAEEHLLSFDQLAMDAAAGTHVAARWVQPGVSLAVFVGSSGSEPECTAAPVGIAATGPGALEATFASDAAGGCSSEGAVSGWVLTLPQPVTATLPVEVTVVGLQETGGGSTVTVQPDDVHVVG